MIGDNIRTILESKSITPYKLSKISGVSNSYLSEILNGKKQNPSVKIVEQIATSLSVRIDELVNEEVGVNDKNHRWGN